tara:strand:- start:1334 stop:2518 length:1185 start_codon:yes stop_codon:yes gene_type:complete
MSGILSAFVGGTYSSAPVNSIAPVVSGTATFGSTLTTTDGTWSGVPTPTFTYQWQRVTTNISGATSSTYFLVQADVGSTIRCVVTATNSIAAVSANSNSTATVAAVVPGAPTIGAATATGSTTATVAYTAPASNGGATITTYTATSSPSGITGTLSQAGSGTITVSGLSATTSYTFTVTATNSVGTSAASAASNSITTSVVPPSAIGDAYQGGYYAGQIGVSGVATHYLVVGPKASSQLNRQWKTSNTTTAGTTSVIDGPTNSAAMNDSSHPAALFCEGLTVGSQTDWYMPAQNELEVCYYNLKPNTQSNSTSYGINANAVPARASNYTAGDPAQTSATDFQSGGIEAFNLSRYWSSTENSATYGWLQIFNVGGQYGNNKTSNYIVRAIRRVPV